MEEDALAAFADLLADDADTVQRPDSLQEFDDYVQLYEYSNGFADFSIWDGQIESEHRIPVGEQFSPLPVKDRSRTSSESPEHLVDDSADVFASFVGETCAFCLESRVRIRCPNCTSAYYCSTEHQAAHSLSHEVSCGSSTTASNGFQGFAPQDVQQELAPADSELRPEMLELLNVFQAVYEQNSDPGHTCSLLQKCISMCERIMNQHYRIPQVVAMHEQATTLLQMFQNREEAAESPFTASPNEDSAASSQMSVQDFLKADVKEALSRIDAEESDIVKDSDGGEEVDGVYRREGICYCKTHIDRERCEQCNVDYRLLNQLHRENADEEVDGAIRKEQDRIESLELQHKIVPPHLDPAIEEPAPLPTQVHDTEDFQSIAKDLNAELDRAREKEEADFLKCFASFQIS